MNTPLPSDLHAEAHLLSCAMIDGPQVLSDCIALGITADTFMRPEHGTLFSAMLRVIGKSLPCDQSTVACELHDAGQFDWAGKYPGIMEASITRYLEPTTLYWRTFAKRVRDAAIRRELIRANATIAEDAGNADGTPANEVLEDAAKTILAIDARSEREDWRAAIASAEKTFECRIDPERQAEADADSVSFGFADMDRNFGAMRAGQVVVIAARPSVGKSSLARQIIAHAALIDGKQTLFASLEVMGGGLALNLAQTISGVSASSARPSMSPRDAKDFRDALKKAASSTLDVLAASSVSIANLRARAEVLRARGTPLRLAVVDYLQLLPDCAPAKGETRASSVGRASRALKAFALAENCVVIVLSQLNRDSTKEGREPQLFDLRESGDIEQDADKVILLHRPSENKTTGRKQEETSDPREFPLFFIHAIQAKGRDDGTGLVHLMFQRAITRFLPVKQNEHNDHDRGI